MNINPVANHRLKLDSLEPQGHYCIVRIDPPKTKTAGGVILPGSNNGRGISAQFAGAAVGKGAPEFKYDFTAVILSIGPEVDNVEVGERVLLTVAAIPVTVVEGLEDHPLGLFDSRDIICKVKI